MTIEHRVISTRLTHSYWSKKCDRCSHEFKSKELRHEWRMLIDSSNYLSGSFWIIHCEDCFSKTMIEWRDALIVKIAEVESKRHD